jgi:tripartite-type tricarboxylate transporter receptor subunit TctC
MRCVRLVLLLLALACPAAAQPFPSRDIRLICGFAPGGTCDLLTRLLAEHLSPVLGVNVVAENRTGASGLIAADTVAKAAPDGHTMLLTTMAFHTIIPQIPGMRMPFDVERDLMPVANVAGITNIMVATPGGPFRTAAELIAHARTRPGQVSYASSGNGSSQHLGAEMFAHAAGLSLLHVPYRGGAPAIIDITAGRTNFVIGPLPEFLGQIRGGGLLAVAVAAAERSPLLPEVPTIGETLPGFAVPNWFGVAGPGGLSGAPLERWVVALQQVGREARFRQRMQENGMAVIIDDPDHFRATIRADHARWGAVIRQAGIRAD